MGIIDPMAIGNVAATGVLEFGNGPGLWVLTLGLLFTAAVTIALSGWRPRRLTQLALPKFSHTRIAAADMSRGK